MHKHRWFVVMLAVCFVIIGACKDRATKPTQSSVAQAADKQMQPTPSEQRH